MNNRKLALLLAFAALFLAGSYAVRAAAAGMGRPLVDSILGPAEPPVPDVMPPGQQIAFWSNRLTPDTRDYITLTHLGRAWLGVARETGDAAAYARAEEAVRRALALNPRYAPANALLGSVLIANHAFAEARSVAADALDDDPGDLQALAVSGDAALEMGDYAAADAAYSALIDNAPGGPAYSRMSRLVWLNGRPDEAIAWMRRAADETVSLDIGGEELAWYRFQLGELYFNSGDLRSARKWYDEAEQAFPGYYLARAGLGKVAAARGHTDEAIDIYEGLVAQLPQPAFIAYLGDLYTLAGDATSAENQFETLELIQTLEQTQQVLYNRQLANFYADHDTNLGRALAFAETELVDRRDIYAYDTLAWVLYRHGRFEEARDASDKALALGTRDATLYFHAGMIAAALGDQASATRYLELALEINPHFNLILARAARDTLEDLTNP